MLKVRNRVHNYPSVAIIPVLPMVDSGYEQAHERRMELLAPVMDSGNGRMDKVIQKV